ncbi:hypothetical protein BWQ96_02111 [Gracilariopsis chorda]|uniref:Uncharacterized protein n=1 Tax=Gracilariopsis chorda TaxID=448386 RepID=A0A2V3J1E1_9FLOR|nr:hypothetical protein BWQ96_02111 [Gracilariopsis chorda]|eukprot:PXF48159.1 hypothetical protein BWQ96_02111 [Gracilariopsis chorda]
MRHLRLPKRSSDEVLHFKVARIAIILICFSSTLILSMLGYMFMTNSLASTVNEIHPRVLDPVNADIHMGARTSRQTEKPQIDVERTNMTIILEHLQFGYESRTQSNAPWMYTSSEAPFAEELNSPSSVFAHTRITWNENGTGNGTCASRGSGKVSRGYVDPFHFFANITDRDFSTIEVELRNMTLSGFNHINTVRGNEEWDVLGQAGDSRRYSGGSFTVFNENQTLLATRNIQWFQNVSYPSPIGEAPPGDLLIGAYFTAEIDLFRSHDEWVRELDPHAVGFVLGIVTAASFGSMDCYTANSYWITLRGFPDLKEISIDKPYASSIYNDTSRSGAKQGRPRGSSVSHIANARDLGSVSGKATTAAVTTSVGGAVGSMTVSVGASASAAAPPGQGISRMLSTASFFARLNEIHGFQSDTMSEFGGSMKPFVAKFPFPFSKNKENDSGDGGGGKNKDDGENDDDDFTVSDEIFAGCAFYTSMIVLAFFLLHLGVWLYCRKKSASTKVKYQAWLVYLFSIAMSYVYAAAVLNSTQYMRSHVGRTGGKPGFYAIAVLQLLFIGLGFTVFVMSVVFLALQRLRKREMKWVPRIEIPDPEVRQATGILGEYDTGDDDRFHNLFECYYSSLAGPRVWLAGLELLIVLLDSICTAVIWNEVIVLGLLVAIYAILFTLIFALAPYVDKNEGRLVTLLGLIDLMVLVVEFMGALGGYDTAERMDYIAVILGFASMSVAILSAIYCDLIPMSITAYGYVRAKLCTFCCIRIRGSSSNGDSESEWSFLAGSWAKTYEGSASQAGSLVDGSGSNATIDGGEDGSAEDEITTRASEAGSDQQLGPDTLRNSVRGLLRTIRARLSANIQRPAVEVEPVDFGDDEHDAFTGDLGEEHRGRFEENGDGERLTWPRVGQVIYRVRVRSSSH